MRQIRVGEVLTFTRTFTSTEILAFAELSQDRGRQHIQPDREGRLMAHGLLTARLPTKLGGELHYLAREMHFEFLKAVYSGEEIRCELVVDEVIDEPQRLKISVSGTCKNPAGEVVLSLRSRGIVPK